LSAAGIAEERAPADKAATPRRLRASLSTALLKKSSNSVMMPDASREVIRGICCEKHMYLRRIRSTNFKDRNRLSRFLKPRKKFSMRKDMMGMEMHEGVEEKSNLGQMPECEILREDD
jgi:hypothetical protein